MSDRPWHPAGPLTPSEERIVADAFEKLQRGELERWSIECRHGSRGLFGTSCCIDVEGRVQAIAEARRRYGQNARRVDGSLVVRRTDCPSGWSGAVARERGRGRFRPAGIGPAIDFDLAAVDVNRLMQPVAAGEEIIVDPEQPSLFEETTGAA